MKVNTSDLSYSVMYSELSNDTHFYSTLSASNEDLLHHVTNLKELKEGEEGWWENTKSILIGVGNVIGHVLNLFKTNVFKFYKSLKRTEIVYYNESNAVTMKLLFKIPYTDICDCDMPFPNGLTTTYMDALDKTKRAIEALDILTKSKSALVNSKKILDGLNKKAVMKDLITNSITALDTTDAQALYDLATKAVDENKNTTKEKRKFKQLFMSMSDLERCNKLAMSFTEYVDQVHPTYKNMTVLSDIFNQIVKFVERNPSSIDKTDVENLGTLAFSIGKVFDMFATLLFIFHKLEHNLVEIFKEVERQHKIGFRSTIIEDTIIPIATFGSDMADNL